MKEENNSLDPLTRAVANSNKQAYNRLFELLWEPMYLYAASIVMDDNLAKDLVQEVWLDYWNRRKVLEIQNIKSYLYKAVRFQCYKKLRDTKFNSNQLEVADSLPSPSSVELEEDVVALYRKIEIILSGLPNRCQEIFRLSRINDYSNQQIAAALNISQRSVENNISIALRKLRKELSVVRLF